MLTFLYSPLGIPESLRQMDGSGVHAFKFVTDDCQVRYVKFTWKSRQGIKGLTPAEAEKIQATNFNHLTQDLYQNIDRGNFPVWDLYIQTMDPNQLGRFAFNPLDTTVIWPESQVPARKVGEMVLNEVPDNFFQWTEQAAFAPSNMIPGIEPSEDRMLQGRLFSYADTQRYRLGANHLELAPNKPRSPVHAISVQDGIGFSSTKAQSVNYFPSRYQSDAGYAVTHADYKACATPLNGSTQQIPFHKTQDFKQAGDLYQSFDARSKNALVEAFGGDLVQVKSPEIRNIITSYLYKADPEYGMRVGIAANANMTKVKELAAIYPN